MNQVTLKLVSLWLGFAVFVAVLWWALRRKRELKREARRATTRPPVVPFDPVRHDLHASTASQPEAPTAEPLLGMRMAAEQVRRRVAEFEHREAERVRCREESERMALELINASDTIRSESLSSYAEPSPIADQPVAQTESTWSHDGGSSYDHSSSIDHGSSSFDHGGSGGDW